MDGFHSLAAVALEWLRETTVAVAVLVAAVLLAQWGLRRWLTPRWRYALWVLVLVRLLMPAAPPSPTSVFNLASDVAASSSAALSAPVPPRARPAASPSPSTSAPSGAAPVVVDLPRVGARNAARVGAPDAARVGAPTAMPAVAVTQRAWPWTSWVTLIWLLGAVVVTAWTLRRERRFSRRLRTANAVTDARVVTLLAEAAATAGVRRPPRIVSTDAVDAPALAGVLRPRLLLPAGLAARLTDDELRFVFAHELAHLRAGDVLVNWVLAAVQALHWFDPFVWLAFTRLRAERESVRDWSALAAQPAAAPVAYGDTLLRLLEGGAARATRPAAVGILEGRAELRRRLIMIARFEKPTVRAVAAGLAVTALVAAAALTGAVLDPSPASAQEKPDDSDAATTPAPQREPALFVSSDLRAESRFVVGSFVRTIRVERQRAEAEWERTLRRTLTETRVTGTGESSLSDLIASLRKATGLNFVFEAEARDDKGDETVTVAEGMELSADQMLRHVLRQVELDYCLTDNVVYVSERHRLPTGLEQRFYDVAPLLERQARRFFVEAAAEDPNFSPDEPIEEYFATDELIDATQSFGDPAAWERDGTSLSTWKGLLVATQTSDAHAKTEAFLNLILNRGKQLALPVPEWEQDLARRLEAPISVAFVDVSLGDAATMLREQTGISIVVPEDYADEPIELSLSDVKRADVLAWIARITRLHVTHADGAVVFSEQPPMHIECYEVQDVVDARNGMGGVDELMDRLRMSVLPRTWENYDMAAVWYWDGMFVIRQTSAVHDGTKEFLATVRRVLGD